MSIPGELRYAESHEWSRIEDDGTITVGITEYAQEQLGDVVYVEVPEIDRVCTAEEGIAVVESVKAASDLYAPVAGTVIAVNEELGDSPELINDSPYESGWIFRIKPEDKAAVNNLMDADGYEKYIGTL